MCLAPPSLVVWGKEYWKQVRKEEPFRKMIRVLIFVLLMGPGVGPLKLPDSLKPTTASQSITEKTDPTNITLTFTAWAAIYREIKDLQVFKKTTNCEKQCLNLFS